MLKQRQAIAREILNKIKLKHQLVAQQIPTKLSVTRFYNVSKPGRSKQNG
jgi:hypothetical protein